MYCFSISTRKDYNAHIFLTTKKDCPNWHAVARRVVVDLDTDKTISNQDVKDTPLGHDWHAPLPPGVEIIYTELYWRGIDALRST